MKKAHRSEKLTRLDRLRSNLVVFFVLMGTAAFCQTSKTPLDRGFIDKTIAYYYAKQMKLHPDGNNFFIERDSFNMNAKTDYGAFHVQFVSKDEAAVKVVRTAKKEARIDRIVIRWISLDTIDVAITTCTIDAKKITKVVKGQKITTIENSITNCSEPNTEIPICRFVYNQPSSAWAQLDEGRLVKKN